MVSSIDVGSFNMQLKQERSTWHDAQRSRSTYFVLSIINSVRDFVYRSPVVIDPIVRWKALWILKN